MLTPWKESYDQPRRHIQKRGISLPTKVHLVKAMVFPVVMYGCESWPMKKAERRRIDALELWCWEKTLESPLDCKQIQPVHSEGDHFFLDCTYKRYDMIFIFLSDFIQYDNL